MGQIRHCGSSSVQMPYNSCRKWHATSASPGHTRTARPARPAGAVQRIMIMLDTNVLSALMRDTPDPAVVEWLDRQPTESIWTTSVKYSRSAPASNFWSQTGDASGSTRCFLNSSTRRPQLRALV